MELSADHLAVFLLAAGLATGFTGCKHGCSAISDEPKAAAGAAELGASAERETLVTWKPPVQVAAGGAERGPWRMNESKFHYVDDPTVAIDHAGTTLVAWVDNRQKDVFFQAYDAAGRPQLTEPTNVSKSPDVFSWLPRIVVGRRGEQVFVLWQEIIFSGGTHGGEILFGRSEDGGRHFDEPLNLSNTTAGAGKGRLTEERWHNGSLDLARGPEKTLYAAWTEYEGALRFSRSTDSGQFFSEPRHVAGTDTRPARGPTLAVSQSGTIYLAWTVGEDPSADVRVSHSTDEGRSFVPPAIVAQTQGHSDAPSIAVGDANTAHLVYAESPDGPWEQYHVQYASANRKTHRFGSPKRISGTQPGDRGAGFPALELGKDNRLYVVWEHYPDYSERPRGLGFSVSTDGGNSFTPPSLIPGTDDSGIGFNGSLQGLLTDKLAVKPGSLVAVVNSRFDPHERSLVRLIFGQPR